MEKFSNLSQFRTLNKTELKAVKGGDIRFDDIIKYLVKVQFGRK